MRKIGWLIFVILCACRSTHSKLQSSHRFQISEPPYGLQKVKALIANANAGDAAIDEKNYLGLSLPEKFTYNMVRRESFSQVCTLQLEKTGEQLKIPAELPRFQNDCFWSTRQLAFFTDNKDSVIVLMKNCILKDGWIGENFKHIIVHINATPVIPLIINTFNASQGDNELLTVLMLLMKDAGYNEFASSAIYKNLYGNKDASYKSFINMSTENADLIIHYATNFYHAARS